MRMHSLFIRGCRVPPQGIAAMLALGLLAGCAGTGLDFIGTPDSPPANTAPAGDVIGTGAVKVALILPLSSEAGRIPAESLRNAAELAMADFSGGQPGADKIQILVKDDKGTPDGARIATQEALSAGADIILGPLFAPNVQAAASVARPAGKPVIAFSSDATAATRGVYLLSFLPQGDVQRVITFAGSRGKKSFAALIPNNAYGSVVEAEFMSAANQGGRRVALVEKYQPGNPASLNEAVGRLKASIGQADSLFLAESEGISGVMQALSAAGITNKTVQILSTGIWNDPRVHAIPALDGAWFAAPDNTRFNQLIGRYQQKYGTAPTRIATLAYDAVTLASALTQNFGTQRFAEATLTNPNGFAGQDGVFRFRTNGLNDRGLAVFEIRSGSARAIAAPPASFATN
jgi:ABC-type branched-subunit amino acid transport system substrate-binding protein